MGTPGKAVVRGTRGRKRRNFVSQPHIANEAPVQQDGAIIYAASPDTTPIDTVQPAEASNVEYTAKKVIKTRGAHSPLGAVTPGKRGAKVGRPRKHPIVVPETVTTPNPVGRPRRGRGAGIAGRGAVKAVIGKRAALGKAAFESIHDQQTEQRELIFEREPSVDSVHLMPSDDDYDPSTTVQNSKDACAIGGLEAFRSQNCGMNKIQKRSLRKIRETLGVHSKTVAPKDDMLGFRRYERIRNYKAAIRSFSPDECRMYTHECHSVSPDCPLHMSAMERYAVKFLQSLPQEGIWEEIKRLSKVPSWFERERQKMYGFDEEGRDLTAHLKVLPQVPTSLILLELRNGTMH